ncbi:MAG: hypothetical protein ABL879_15430 [Devosia sp.]
MGIRVKALRPGFYGSLRAEGDEFVIMKKQDLGTWMVEVDKLPGRKGEPAAGNEGSLGLD